MSSVDVVTVSSRGQVSIPAEIRRDLEIEEGEKLMVVSKGENILLKKVDASILDGSFRDILEPMWKAAEESEVDDSAVEEIIDEQRAKEGE